MIKLQILKQVQNDDLDLDLLHKCTTTCLRWRRFNFVELAALQQARLQSVSSLSSEALPLYAGADLQSVSSLSSEAVPLFANSFSDYNA